MKIREEYKNEIAFYLGIIIREDNKDKFVIIDTFYETIKELTEDYLKYDNIKKSLLDSIESYVNKNKKYINEKIKKCFE